MTDLVNATNEFERAKQLLGGTEYNRRVGAARECANFDFPDDKDWESHVFYGSRYKQCSVMLSKEAFEKWRELSERGTRWRTKLIEKLITDGKMI